MKKIIIATILLCASIAESKALHCGPRGNFWSSMASHVAIPDYFPPENFLARMIASPFFGDLSICEEEFEPVYLGQSCMVHDQCYETLGADKENCDETLIAGWMTSCEERYMGSDEIASYCLSACKDVTQIMYDAMRYDDGSFCPSCIAFENSQQNARS